MKDRVLSYILLVSLYAGLAFSQSKTTGTLSGTIIDASNSLVPGAKVTVTSADTGATFEATSDSQGEYRLPLLTPGTYDVKIEKAGFG